MQMMVSASMGKRHRAPTWPILDLELPELQRPELQRPELQRHELERVVF